MNLFLKSNIKQIRKGGINLFIKKLVRLFLLVRLLPIYVIALFFVLIIRIIKPFLLIRFRGIYSARIGHFAGETEQYLCERDSNINTPNRRYLDIFYLAHKPICNKYLGKMWGRIINIWPAFFVKPIHNLNKLIPGFQAHEIGNNTSWDRDVHNLLDKLPSHLTFTDEEKSKGKAFLKSIGIKKGEKFVCLHVRDDSYLKKSLKNIDFSYHDYRNSDIDNYVLAAEALADLGYYVLRMGVHVNKKIPTENPKIIDYASSKLRTDFLDIYLAGHCSFCISTGSGFDNIITILRTPIVFVNMLPVGYSILFSKSYLLIPKHHYSLKLKRRLTMSEIFSFGVGFCKKSECFDEKNIDVIENTPEEIKEAALEMVMRIEGSWDMNSQDILNQEKFKEIFPNNAIDPISKQKLHGKIESNISSYFLRENPEWLN